MHCFEQLLKRCDAVQVSTEALQFCLQELAQRIEVFPNQLVDLSSPRFDADEFIATPDSPLVLGWGDQAAFHCWRTSRGVRPWRAECGL